MLRENVQFLDELRVMVEQDVRQSEPTMTQELCDYHLDTAVRHLTLSLWAMGLQDGEPRARNVLREKTGPLVPEYWADRPWPPEQPEDVLQDFEQWMAMYSVLDRRE